VLQLLLADLAVLLAVLLALPPHHVPVLPPHRKQVNYLWHKQFGVLMTVLHSAMKGLLLHLQAYYFVPVC
jgi:hypothetical protein